jgi:uncharacterized peroxidase-related enzyme
MSTIKVVTPEEASGRVKAIYDELQAAYGMVPNVVQVFSITPEILEAQLKLYRAVMPKQGALSASVQEMIAAVVSDINSCQYCMRWHSHSLAQMGLDEEQVGRICSDYQTANLEPKDLGLLQFADKMTRDPATMTDADVDHLKELEWTDEAILEATCIAAFFNFLNRVVNALGVFPEGA